jgi:hypothetical protein
MDDLLRCPNSNVLRTVPDRDGDRPDHASHGACSCDGRLDLQLVVDGGLAWCSRSDRGSFYGEKRAVLPGGVGLCNYQRNYQGLLVLSYRVTLIQRSE